MVGRFARGRERAPGSFRGLQSQKLPLLQHPPRRVTVRSDLQTRIRQATSGDSIAAMIFMRTPQRGHCRTSNSNVFPCGFSEFSRGSKVPTRGVSAYPLRALKEPACTDIIEPYATLAGDLLPRPLIPPMRFKRPKTLTASAPLVTLPGGGTLKSYVFKVVVEDDEHEDGRPAFRAYCSRAIVQSEISGFRMCSTRPISK